MPYEQVTLPPLAGLNEDEDPTAIRPEQLRLATNCARRGSLTGTRPGMNYDSEYSEAISGTPAIQGIYEHRDGRDDNRQLIVVAGGQAYYGLADTLTKSSCTISSGAANIWSFASYQNLTWAAGGASGDSIWTWDGDTSGTPTATGRLSTLGIKPQYVFSKFNCLFLGGFLDGTDPWNNPLCARYPDYATDATDAANWPTSNSIPGVLLGENGGVGSFGTEYNTGFGSYQDNSGDYLMFLTNKRIIAYRQNPAPNGDADRFIQADAVANGCVSQHAFVDLGFDQGDAVYVSPNGIHSMALSQQYGNRVNSFLSWPIRKTWETINRSMLKRFWGAYWPTEGIVLFGIATGSNTYLDTILCMDIRGASQITPDTVRWYRWKSSGGNLNVLAPARDADGKPRIYVGTTDGKVGYIGRESYADFGTGYTVSFRNKDNDYGYPMTTKSCGDAFFVVSGSGTYEPKHQFVFDDGTIGGAINSITVSASGFVLGVGGGTLGSTPLGGAERISRERIPGTGSGHTISHKFTHSGNNEPFFIGQISHEVAAQGIAEEAAA